MLILSANLNFFSFYISSNIFVSLKNLIIFSTSQLFSSSVLMSPWILYFFLLALYWRQFCRQCFIVSLWFQHAAFLHVSCSFFDIKCPWVNIVSPIRIPLSLTSIFPTAIACARTFVFFCCIHHQKVINLLGENNFILEKD